MTIGFIGLGKMGSQMVTRLREAGHDIVVTDHDAAAIANAVSQGATGAPDRAALVTQLANAGPAVIWLMIPAQFVDDELDALVALLPADSIIIDGGNSDFRQTRQRAARCLQARVQLIDVGTSGGILGLKDGFSMMVGGDEQAYKIVEPAIKSLAHENGYQYFGPSGAGHYVKMVHNAIEYGLMEAYAEGYHLLKDSVDYPALDLASIANVWQHGSIIDSGLNGLIADIFQQNPELEGIDGYVAESGEARWTLEAAKAQNLALPVVQVAIDDRLRSQQGEINFGTKLLAAMRNAFGGHKLNQ